MTKHKLKKYPESPNCVTAQTQQKNKKMDPISFYLDPKEVKSVIKMVVENL